MRPAALQALSMRSHLLRPLQSTRPRLRPRVAPCVARIARYSTERSDSEPPETRRLLIVYHSMTNGAKQMAQAAYEAASAAARGDPDPLSPPQQSGSSASSSSASPPTSSSSSDSSDSQSTTSSPDSPGDPSPDSPSPSPSPRITVHLQHATATTPDDLLQASAYIFATPENLATMAGKMKDLFDRTYYPCLGHLNGRAYAALVCAGSDGEGAMRQLDRICLGWRLKKAAEGVIVITHAQDYERCHAEKIVPEGELGRCREVGAGIVEGLRLGMF